VGFDKIDTTLDGLISEAEFKAAFAGSATEATLAAMFRALDTNGNGTIEKLEAIATNTNALKSTIIEASKGTISDKAGLYNALRETGLTDADIRSVVEGAVGPQTDDNWTLLRDIAEGFRLRREAELDVSAVISLIDGQSSFPTSLKDALINGVSLVDVTVKGALADNTPADIKRILVEQQGVYNSIIQAGIKEGLPADVMRVISDQGGVYSTTIKAALESTVDPDVKRLIVDEAGVYNTLIKGAVDTNSSEDIKNILVAQAGNYKATVTGVLASDLPADVKRLAITGAGNYSASITAAIATGQPDHIKNLLVEQAGSYNALISATLKDGIDPEAKKIALATSSDLARTVTAAIKEGASSQAISLALASSSDITRTVAALLGSSNNQQAYDLAIAKASDFTRTITAALGISSNQQALDLALASGGSISRSVIASINTSSLTADQLKYLNLVTSGASTGSTSSSVTLSGKVTFEPDQALKSIFDNISETNKLLVRGLQLDVGQLLGVSQSYAKTLIANPNLEYDKNMSREENGGFPGTYVLANSSNSHLSAISTNTANTASHALSAASTLTNIANKINTLRVVFDRGSGPDGRTSGGPVFAKGGVFTNSIVTKPTEFPLGLMGEAGEEAIMPLSRGPDGTLGVRNFGSGESSSSNSAEVVAELIRLRVALESLQGQNSNENYHIIKHTMRVADRLDRWDDGDRMNVNIDNDQPVQVEIAP
jgi:hypothetical protein